MSIVKPVAWMDAEGDVYRKEPPEGWCPPNIPLYSAARKREWDELTQDEVVLIVDNCSLVTPSDFYFAQAIEDKLKEKNT
jgi:hypothetical protein